MNVEIAQRLAERRKQAGLSQEALAARLGVSRQAVSKWERSESSPDTDNLIALAQLYGLSLDDLLYVDEEIRDDVTFEAADRAAKRQAEQETATVSPADPPPAPADAAAASDASGGTEAASSGKKGKVHIGPGGIHVEDGDEYVHVSWRDGVHVKDAKKGEEVHVGWDGVHVKSPGNSAGDDDVVIDGAKVVINGEQFDSWQDAHARYHHGWDREERWCEPCGYTVRGERFDSIDDARAKYGDEVGKSIPVRKHYLREFEKSWVKFPYPLVVMGHGAVPVPDHPALLYGGSRHRAQAPRAAGVGRVSHPRGGLVLLDGVRAEPAASRLGCLSHHSRSGVARA